METAGVQRASEPARGNSERQGVVHLEFGAAGRGGSAGLSGGDGTGRDVNPGGAEPVPGQPEDVGTSPAADVENRSGRFEPTVFDRSDECGEWVGREPGELLERGLCIRAGPSGPGCFGQTGRGAGPSP